MNRRWLWILVALVAVGAANWFGRDRHVLDLEPGQERVRQASPAELANAVYLRFLQDEGARSPAEKLQRAIVATSRDRALGLEQLKQVLNSYATEVLADPTYSSYAES